MKNGWQRKPLGEACRFIDYRGRTPEKVESGVRLITAKNVKMGFLQTEPLEFVKPEIYDSWMTRGIPKIGDVIFTTEAPLANVAQLDTDDKVVFAQRIIVLQPPTPVLDRTFLKYQLLSDEAQKRIHEKGTGATVKGIKAKLLKAVEITIPPLPEQRRIVGILDEAFAGIATAKAHAEQNLQNARALFESHLNAVFTKGGKGWVEKPMGDVVLFQGGSQPPKSTFIKERLKGYIRLIQIRDYKSDKHIVYIPEKTGRRQCKADDVMIGRYGPPLFQILRGIDGAYNVALMKAIPDETHITKDYLYYFLKNGRILAHVIHASHRAAGQTGVRKETLQAYPIPYPKSLSRQAEIVLNSESLYADSQRLESIYQRKIAALDELKKSLLHQAFSGQL